MISALITLSALFFLAGFIFGWVSGALLARKAVIAELDSQFAAARKLHAK